VLHETEMSSQDDEQVWFFGSEFGENKITKPL
jgi:hypothetical protein